MLLVRTFVAASEIEGVGVYAGEDIPAGTLIWRLDPRLDVTLKRSDLPELPVHMQEYIERYSFPHLEMDDAVVIEVDNGRFMNHSDQPNTDFRIFDKGYALRDIKEGEELTCSYFEFDPSFTGGFVGEGPVQAPARGLLNGHGDTQHAG